MHRAERPCERRQEGGPFPARPPAHVPEGRPCRILDRAFRIDVESAAERRESQCVPARIIGIASTDDHTRCLETREQTGHRARMQPQRVGQLTGREARLPAERANDESLWAGDAERLLHVLGDAPQLVIHLPNEGEKGKDLVTR